MTTVNDAFTGTTALSGNWTVFGSASGSLSCVSGLLAANADGESNKYYWSADTFGTSQYAKMTFTTLQPNNGYYGAGPMIFCDPSDIDGYYAIQIDTAIYLGRIESGSITNHGSYALSAGDIVEIRGVPNGADLDLSILINGVSRITYTDVAPHMGANTRIAINSYSTGAVFRGDDFEGGDYSAGSPDVTTGASGSAATSGHGTAAPVTSIGL